MGKSLWEIIEGFSDAEYDIFVLFFITLITLTFWVLIEVM